jgi:hypothetical protein
LFTSSEPRWLGVQFNRQGETEPSRVRLTSVPYALKAADAETLGGHPLSAFLLAPNATATGLPDPAGLDVSSSGALGSTQAGKLKPRQSSGTTNCIGLFTNTTDLGCANMWQINNAIGVETQNPTPQNSSSIVPRIVVTGTSSLQGVRTVNPGGSGSQIILLSTRGSDANVYTQLQSGDGIGTFSFNGTDGTQFSTGGRSNRPGRWAGKHE